MRSATCPHCDTALTLPAASEAAQVRCPGCQKTFPNPAAPRENAAVSQHRPPALAALANDTPAARMDRLDHGCLFATSTFGMLLQAVWVYALAQWLALPPAPNDVLLALGFTVTIGTYGAAILMTGSETATTRIVGRVILIPYIIQGVIGLLVALAVVILIVLAIIIR